MVGLFCVGELVEESKSSGAYVIATCSEGDTLAVYCPETLPGGPTSAVEAFSGLSRMGDMLRRPAIPLPTESARRTRRVATRCVPSIRPRRERHA
jgi:hypothetical protein